MQEESSRYAFLFDKKKIGNRESLLWSATVFSSDLNESHLQLYEGKVLYTVALS